MSLWRYRDIMKENVGRVSVFGNELILALLALFVVSAGMNIARGVVPHPAAFGITILGLFFLPDREAVSATPAPMD